MGTFPECDVKLCDFEISRVILEGTEVREILGTPDYVGEQRLFMIDLSLIRVVNVVSYNVSFLSFTKYSKRFVLRKKNINFYNI